MPTARRTTRRRGAATLRRLERASGALATQSVARMDEALPWFRAMPAEQRSWVGLVAHAGIAAFLQWLRAPAGDASEISGEIFGAAPRELTRAITLQQTVELVRVTIEVVESQVDTLAAPGEEGLLYEAVLRYSREVAFAAAQVYAQAAEERGAWDARLEALVVDALLRGESDDALRSRASALGWGTPTYVCVLAGAPAAGDPDALLDRLRQTAKAHELDILSAVHGDRLVLVLGSAEPPEIAVRPLLEGFAAGPVVLGTSASDLSGAAHSATVALAGLRAVAARPDAPRPVRADDLLSERALAGDEPARRALVEEIYSPLAGAGGALLDTVATYVSSMGSLEGTARALFVHPNTVRYRLRKAEEVCHYAATDPRDAFTLRVAIVLGRLAAATPEL
ncbi:MAG: PucR family transcriptional regulator [Mycobacteriales bacterium]